MCKSFLIHFFYSRNKLSIYFSSIFFHLQFHDDFIPEKVEIRTKMCIILIKGIISILNCKNQVIKEKKYLIGFSKVSSLGNKLNQESSPEVGRHICTSSPFFTPFFFSLLSLPPILFPFFLFLLSTKKAPTLL